MRRTLMFTGIAVCLIALGGCAEMDAKFAAQQQAADQAKCEGYGYQPGTDRFADCMMSTAHNRDMQQAMARQQDAMQKQQAANAQAQQRAADDAADAQHQADIQRMMNSGTGFTPPTTPTNQNCTSTTTSQQSGNAGSSTTTTTCH